MKPFTIEVADISAAMEKAQTALQKYGGTLKGDDTAGHYTSNGVEGSYTVDGNKITIKVDKKPFIAPEGLVRSTVEKFFRE